MNPINTPRKIKSQQTQQRILKAAVSIIKKHGYEYMTVRNICEEAAVSTGSFYHFFQNKDEVLYNYILEGYRKYQSIYKDDATDDNDVKAVILGLYSVYDDYCAENGVDFLSEYYTSKNQCINMDFIYTNGKDANDSLGGRTLLEIEKAQKRGHLKSDLSAREIANDICIINKGAIFDWCLSKGEFNLTSTASRLMSYYLDNQLTEQYYADINNDA